MPPHWSIIFSGRINSRFEYASSVSGVNKYTPVRGNWPSPWSIFNPQPLDKIREYFGEKVPFSFARIQFFIWSFLAISIVAGVASLVPPLLKNKPHEEVCSKNNTPFILCPTCKGEGCRFKRLKDSCGDLTPSVPVSNVLDIFKSLICAIYGTVQAWRVFSSVHRKRMKHIGTPEATTQSVASETASSMAASSARSSNGE
ncbi:unnamed protein product [Hymenolepis diminuta]|uniref:Anoctamin n=1 Tax=Hymenolepis diminuta TaxID=6216 RepID=A0A564YXW1_HYMDI|nr:unnamed protein product [Hymenolepis diminuta]